MKRRTLNTISLRERTQLSAYLERLVETDDDGDRIIKVGAADLARRASEDLGFSITSSNVNSTADAIDVRLKSPASKHTPMSLVYERLAALEKFATTIDPNWKESL